MKYKIGERVRVKSFEEIQKTLDGSNHLRGEIIFFNDEMKIHCGKVYGIESYSPTGPYYQLKYCKDGLGSFWQWPEEWIEPINRFKAEDLVVVKPDLIPGNIYGCETFIEDMIPTKGTIVEIKSVDYIRGAYHIKENHWSYTDEMLLTLEEAFRPGRMVRKKDGSKFPNGKLELMVGDFTVNGVWLPEISTYLSAQDLKILHELTADTFTLADFRIDVERTKKQCDLKDKINSIIKNKKDYEDQLQREKTRIRGAEVPEGHRVRSRKCKATIVVGHLSNQARAGY